MSQKGCGSCGSALSELTPLFYCCDANRPLCRRCRPSSCPSCRRADWRQMREMACLICRRKLAAGEAFREEVCGQYFCARCVAHSFLPHVLGGCVPIIVEMRCGHYKDRLEVEAFLSDYCINCGFRFRPALDLELQNGLKLCEFCYRQDDRRQFEELFQLCLSCGQPLTFREADSNRDFPMCHQCSAHQTLIQQSIVGSNPPQTKPASLISNLKSALAESSEQDSEEPSEQLSIVSRFSAFEIEEREGVKRKGKLASLKALSKNSVEIRVENYKLPAVERSGKLIKCYLCSVMVGESGTLPNTTYGSERICKLCFAATFDKSYLSYTRYNNYLPDSRATSAHKPNAPSNPMKLSMLPPQPTHTQSREMQPLTSLLKHSVPSKVEKKEAWEQVAIRNSCDFCKARTAMIIRPDKKKLCVQCKNKHG